MKLSLKVSPDVYPALSFRFYLGELDFESIFAELLEDGVCTPKQLKKAYKGVSIDECDGLMAVFGGALVIWTKGGYTLKNIGVITHETLHAVYAAGRHIQVEDDEFDCYLMGYLLDELYKASLKSRRKAKA